MFGCSGQVPGWLYVIKFIFPVKFEIRIGVVCSFGTLLSADLQKELARRNGDDDLSSRKYMLASVSCKDQINIPEVRDTFCRLL